MREEFQLQNPMRAVHAAPGAPLTIVEAERPAPAPGEILIRVRAAGVNRPDLIQRAGMYAPPPGASGVLGLEVAGDVAAIGAGVTRWREGDRVCALLGGGGYADYAVAHEGSALPVPPSLSFAEAACLPETVFTVWANVFESGALKPGEALLVHGGASGIGTTAIQMALAHGAKVFATASGAKAAFCTSLGARGIDYASEDFEAIVKAEGGADVILDMVGAPYLAKNLNILNAMGRLVYIAFLHGAKAEIDLMRLMLKRLTITGSTLRARPVEEKARLAREVERNVWPWIAAGKVRPIMDSTFPLEDAERAHARMQSGAHIGKIALSVS